MDLTLPLDISHFLPHRAPFLMVDQVISIDESHVHTNFLITEDCIFVEDGVLNEVGLIENAAQTCSAITGKEYHDVGAAQKKAVKLIGFISSIRKANIYRCPKIGATIESKAQMVSQMETDAYSICTLACVIYENDVELVSCDLNMVIQEIPG